jgi:hypothetical protein
MLLSPWATRTKFQDLLNQKFKVLFDYSTTADSNARDASRSTATLTQSGMDESPAGA